MIYIYIYTLAAKTTVVQQIWRMSRQVRFLLISTCLLVYTLCLDVLVVVVVVVFYPCFWLVKSPCFVFITSKMESAVVVLEANGWRNSDLHFAVVSAKCNGKATKHVCFPSKVCPEVGGHPSVWPFQPVENYDKSVVHRISMKIRQPTAIENCHL
jgi:hypothetical protein